MLSLTLNYQALTYRVSHHSTSDDSTKYRPVDEIEHWRTIRDPVSRFKKWVEGNGWWSDADESELRSNVRKKVTICRLNLNDILLLLSLWLSDTNWIKSNSYWMRFKLQKKQRNLHLQHCLQMFTVIFLPTYASKRDHFGRLLRSIRRTTLLMYQFNCHG